MTALSFVKASGAGNDFVLVDGRAGVPLPPAELARRLCPRRVAVGADGLIVLEAASEHEVRVSFHNADGSVAGFCGNGARCLARWVVAEGIASAPLLLRFPGVEARAEAQGDAIVLRLPIPRWVEPRETPFEALRALVDEPGLVDAGVWHLVGWARGDATTVDELHAALAAARPEVAAKANVTLIRRDGEALRVATVELGAGKTQACGSAAVAAAFAEHAATGRERIEVVPPSGIPLEVEILPDVGQATLAGDARVIYRGEIEIG